jgi:hypothetical protein
MKSKLCSGRHGIYRSGLAWNKWHIWDYGYSLHVYTVNITVYKICWLDLGKFNVHVLGSDIFTVFYLDLEPIWVDNSCCFCLFFFVSQQLELNIIYFIRFDNSMKKVIQSMCVDFCENIRSQDMYVKFSKIQSTYFVNRDIYCKIIFNSNCWETKKTKQKQHELSAQIGSKSR